MAATDLCDVGLVEGPVAYSQAEVIPEASGAECTFLGRTRLEVHSEHGRLQLLRLRKLQFWKFTCIFFLHRYEAHASMAVKVLRKIAEESLAKYNLLKIRIIHSVGEVKVGEASILVQCFGRHRIEAFEVTFALPHFVPS